MTYTYNNLPETDYDRVIVFDMLSNDERTNYNISQHIKDVFTAAGTPIVQIGYLSNKKELIDGLKAIRADAENGKKFIIHFVSHGNKTCIGFEHTEEPVRWEDIGYLLAEINAAANNTLVLNMTSCFGIHGIKIADVQGAELPFFGLIGYAEEIHPTYAANANKLFYTYLLQRYPINKAVALLQETLKDDKFLCISAQGYNLLKDMLK